MNFGVIQNSFLKAFDTMGLDLLVAKLEAYGFQKMHSFSLVATFQPLNNISNPTSRNNAWKYDAKISAVKSYVQCELSILHNKVDRFMETFNKTISNFETKPYEIPQDNIEFLQNELCSKDEIIKTLMETQTTVLENLPLSKPPQQTENNT